MITRRDFNYNHDFQRIRDFLSNTFPADGKPRNWGIERWNSAFFVSRIMHRLALVDIAARIKIWEEAGELVAVVHPEGEKRGEAYIQLRHAPIPETTMVEMFDYAEKNLSRHRPDGKFMLMAVPEGDELRRRVARERGYVREPETEVFSSRHTITPEPAPLPAGYRYKNGREISPTVKALAHGKAFGYDQDVSMLNASLQAFSSFREAPDYRPDLDLNIVDDQDEVISFCNVWYDPAHRIATLEPVGTIGERRRQGWGRLAVEEAIRRVREIGATRVYVGSDHPFYRALGFEVAARNEIWKWQEQPTAAHYQKII